MNKTQNENDLIELTLKRYQLYLDFAEPRDREHEATLNLEINEMDDGIDAAIYRVNAERVTPSFVPFRTTTLSGVAL